MITGMITSTNILPSTRFRGRWRPHHMNIRILTNMHMAAGLTEIREIIGKAAISESAQEDGDRDL